MLRLPDGNRILDALPQAERHVLADHLQHESLYAGQAVYVCGEPMMRVLFPLTCMLSKIKDMQDGARVEVAAIGCEGMSGISLTFDARDPSIEVLCSIAGTTLTLEAETFLRLLAELPAFKRLVTSYASASYAAIAQIAACNRFHSIDARCARWLLSSGRRAGRDSYDVTHEHVAMALGANRPAVSTACRSLADAGLIRYPRGRVMIVDAQGLERASCECYAALEALWGARATHP